MRFRPCIDIHNGKVKQIVGGSLRDAGDHAAENFVSEKDAAWFADLYKRDGLTGGHVILLNPVSSPYYEATRRQAMKALAAYPGGLQLGGGVTDQSAADYLKAGASHVIVTSYVFRDGQIQWENLQALKKAVGRERIVLDVSCRKKDGRYYIVTDRWQKFTDVVLDGEILEKLADYCDEFLVHGVDNEGKAAGADTELTRILAKAAARPVTYAGGIGSLEDLRSFQKASEGKLDFTIGSALSIFGGTIPYDAVKTCKKSQI